MLLGDLVVGLCFGSWVDVAVGFSFGGVVSLLSVLGMTLMLVCFGELVDVVICFLYPSFSAPLSPCEFSIRSQL